jgi:hypothetical protein
MVTSEVKRVDFRFAIFHRFFTGCERGRRGMRDD